MRHEGIEALADGTVFVIDELNGGSIYKFVPTKRGDLSDGQLYALKLTGLTDADQLWNPATYRQGRRVRMGCAGHGDRRRDTDSAANAVNATEFGRPEDVEVIGSILYVANTSPGPGHRDRSERAGPHLVCRGRTERPRGGRGAGVTGFNNPDNLAQGPDGALWVVEDNYLSTSGSQRDQDHDGTADTVEQFASLKDTGAEISGIYFGKDPRRSPQHPAPRQASGRRHLDHHLPLTNHATPAGATDPRRCMLDGQFLPPDIPMLLGRAVRAGHGVAQRESPPSAGVYETS